MDLEDLNLHGHPIAHIYISVNNSFTQRIQHDLQIAFQRKLKWNVDVTGHMCFLLLCMLLFVNILHLHLKMEMLRRAVVFY